MIRRLAACAALALCVVFAAGCAPEPEPTPSVPAFATEEEAFAAAEETYRAYVDALNQVDLSDPATFEDVFAWTTGEANADLRKSFSQWHADGWSVHGQSVILLAEPDTDSSVDSPALAVCLDVSQVAVTDSDGASVVDESRPGIQSMTVLMERSVGSSTGLKISDLKGREGPPECGT